MFSCTQDYESSNSKYHYAQIKTISHNDQLTILDPTCGPILWIINWNWRKKKTKNDKYFYCPNPNINRDHN